ncbi:ADP-ribosyltransferase domain-containing protein [Rhizobium sp. FY34]|uniref:ADP-ribosyltransferase domain-containing protein n=1 Tax=Rhizobium sp. FY34 TaxID=2562309 RepID=UPI0010C146D5|nr:ADP-ribosyltransferase domain-containing protein [Rhizobium sp. FY34]
MATWYDGLGACLGDRDAYELNTWANSEHMQALAASHGLTQPQLNSLHAYTLNHEHDGATVFQRLNHFLRFPREAIDHRSELEALVIKLISAIDELPPWRGTAYRRANLPGDLLDMARLGYFADAGFLSCTTKPDLKVFDGRDWLTLRAITGRLIDSLSANPDEGEVIFRPNTRFAVSRLEETEDGAILILNEV